MMPMFGEQVHFVGFNSSLNLADNENSLEGVDTDDI
ncbi:hypothetical protein NIES25_32250 [Nostoc linckia NIES-25]|nr:hypothetical protein NIES25_32250 [Nostoc linckia NIES-25]